MNEKSVSRPDSWGEVHIHKQSMTADLCLHPDNDWLCPSVHVNAFLQWGVWWLAVNVTNFDQEICSFSCPIRDLAKMKVEEVLSQEHNRMQCEEARS